MPKKPRTTIDDLDLKIVHHLWDGRTAFAEISEKLGITTNTVRARVERLQKTGVLQIIGLVDPAAIPGHSSAFIGFKAETPKIKQVYDNIKKLKGIVVAVLVSGKFDILAVVMFNEKFTYRNFIYEELPKIEGIISTETFFVVEADNYNLRYVL